MASVNLAEQVQRWRSELNQARSSLRDHYQRSAASQILLQQHCHLIDRVLAHWWDECNMPEQTALIAVGGYGRGELFPHSDVDLLILLPEENSSNLSEQVGVLLSSLWDIGLEVGHSVRSLAQCKTALAEDISIQTSLLENRFLLGSRTLYKRFKQMLKDSLDPIAFYRAKLLEQQQRHLRYHDTAYKLEPNIKESPGGLRDLHTIVWIARAAGLGHNWSVMVKDGFLLPEERRQLLHQERFIKDLRIRLHYLANRREDRLVFDLQSELAAKLNLKDDNHKRASEKLMQRYYQAAKAIQQFNVILLQNLNARLLPGQKQFTVLNEDFSIENELLALNDPQLFVRKPSAILDSFLILQRHAELKGMSANTLRALWRNKKQVDHRFRKQTENRAKFIAMLREPRGITHELRRMNQYGILGRYIPAFGRIVGQMQHDLFHVYTVDEHILMVIRNLRRFTEVQHAHEYPLCSRLIADFVRPEVLYLAALFHDIAKGQGGDHSQLGAHQAKLFCHQHDLPREDSELVAWLVENHLLLSLTAQKQDITHPEVVRRFADAIKTERRLIALYLLTVADIRGTSPKVWNAWKAKLLEDIFHSTRQALSGPLFSMNLHDSLAAKQAEAQQQLRLCGINEGQEDMLWRELDLAYFQRHSADEIAWHAHQLHFRINSHTPTVVARTAEEGLQVMVYLPDQKDLFARICSFFSRIGLSIVEAKIHTTKHAYALDTFLLLDPQHSGIDYRDITHTIEVELQNVLIQKPILAAPSGGRISRQQKHFPLQPEVRIFPDDKGAHYILEIVAGDRPGLLAKIAYTLARHQTSVHNAKINTLGDRAEDVFLIDGANLADDANLLRLENDLLNELEM